MCTGSGSGNFNPIGPTQNLINPRKNINSNEEWLRKDFGPGGQSDAARAMKRSDDEQPADVADAPISRDLTAPVDNRGTALQRRKPRSLLSAAGGGGDASPAIIGASMAKAVLGA